MNKYSNMSKVERVDEKKKIIKFIHLWIGDRKPEFVAFPNSNKVKVLHMREGKIILENGKSGTYIRFQDNQETNEHAIEIEIEE